jgi:hypothetical protein
MVIPAPPIWLIFPGLIAGYIDGWTSRPWGVLALLVAEIACLLVVHLQTAHEPMGLMMVGFTAVYTVIPLGFGYLFGFFFGALSSRPPK